MSNPGLIPALTELQASVDELQQLDQAIEVARQRRAAAICGALAQGAPVGMIVTMTGLTRGRVFQIRRERCPEDPEE